MPEPANPWEFLGFLNCRQIWRHCICGFTTPTQGDEKRPPADCRICSVMCLANNAIGALKTTRQVIDSCAGHAEDCASLAELGVDCTCWLESTLEALEGAEDVDGERLLPDDRAELEKRISELETTGAADGARADFLLRMIDANGHHTEYCSANKETALESPLFFSSCDCWLAAVRQDKPIEPEPVRLVEDCLDDLKWAAEKLGACAETAKKVIRGVETNLRATGIRISAFVQVRENLSIGWGKGPVTGRGSQWGFLCQLGEGGEGQLVSAPDQILLMAVPYLDTLATQLVKNAQRLLDGAVGPEVPVEEGGEA